MKPRYPAFTMALLVLCPILMTGCVMKSTDTTEVGVRTRTFALVGDKGVQDRVYEPGSTFFMLPVVNDWHTFDTRLYNLEMTATPARGDRMGADDLVFKTVDGNDISLDVIISWRIDREMAPYILQNVARNDDELKENVVRTIARSKPRDIFGELMTEEFYRAEERAAKAEAAREKLNEILNPYGVVIERVGTKDYRFNPSYQQAIQDRKVADQQAEKYKSETSAVRELYKRKIEEAKGENERLIAQADGEYQRAVIEADAYFEARAKEAEAVRAEGSAEAEGIRELNEALSGSGGEAMVKLAVADALKGKRIVPLPIGGGGLDVRTTDINALLQLYGLKGMAAPDGK